MNKGLALIPKMPQSIIKALEVITMDLINKGLKPVMSSHSTATYSGMMRQGDLMNKGLRQIGLAVLIGPIIFVR